jgi:hypothetical protein
MPCFVLSSVQYLQWPEKVSNDFYFPWKKISFCFGNIKITSWAFHQTIREQHDYMLYITHSCHMARNVLTSVSGDENFSMSLRFGESWC